MSTSQFTFIYFKEQFTIEKESKYENKTYNLPCCDQILRIISDFFITVFDVFCFMFKFQNPLQSLLLSHLQTLRGFQLSVHPPGQHVRFPSNHPLKIPFTLTCFISNILYFALKINILVFALYRRHQVGHFGHKLNK